MAGIDTRNGLLTPVGPRTSGATSIRLQAVKEAQRAFFNAALAGEAQTATTAVSKTQAAGGVSPPAPDGSLRPGSVVDIKV